MENKENNTYIDAPCYDINFYAPFDGNLSISAEYCKIHCIKMQFIELNDDVFSIDMFENEYIEITSIVNLRTFTFKPKDIIK